jgi:dTDP-4-dehydrorhamnose reductase
MRILITGADGQLGGALSRRAVGHSVVALELVHLDICDPAETRRQITAARPDVIINAAAITDVDGCERDPDTAYDVNALGARNVALAASAVGAALVQVSTDYVFDGTKGVPYWEFDVPSPVNAYGASKLAGEELVRAVHNRVYIARTAWLYGVGFRNFVTKILGKAARESELSVVDNEVGSPTFCDDLADAILALAATGVYGTYHLTSEGECSRHEFARAILDGAGRPGYPLRPVDHYPRMARPPAYAPLRNFAAARLGVVLPAWREGLQRFFERGGGPLD